jgi:inorganic pyrophosphatase
VAHGDFILPAVPVGGLRMIDKGEADDKIIAVLEGDGGVFRYQDY